MFEARLKAEQEESKARAMEKVLAFESEIDRKIEKKELFEERFQKELAEEKRKKKAANRV